MMNQLNTPLAKDVRESRCHCGNLLARLCPEGVELKCRRCKRTMLIAWGTAAVWHGVAVQWEEPTTAQKEEECFTTPERSMQCNTKRF